MVSFAGPGLIQSNFCNSRMVKQKLTLVVEVAVKEMSVVFWSWSWSSAVSLQMAEYKNPVVGRLPLVVVV